MSARRRRRRGRDSESCLVISHIYKDAWSLAQAKGLPSLIYHEPVLEVRFVRGAAGTMRILTIRDGFTGPRRARPATSQLKTARLYREVQQVHTRSIGRVRSSAAGLGLSGLQEEVRLSPSRLYLVPTPSGPSTPKAPQATPLQSR
jgi:hypothetical protein